MGTELHPKWGAQGHCTGRGPAPRRSGRQGPGTGSVGLEATPRTSFLGSSEAVPKVQDVTRHGLAIILHRAGMAGGCPAPHPEGEAQPSSGRGADPGSTASLTGVLAPFLRSPGTTWTHPCHVSREHPVGQPCPEYSRESFPVLRLSGGSGRLGTGMCEPPGAVGTLGNTACSPSCHSRSLRATPHPSRALLSPGKQRREAQAHMGRGLRGPWGL